MSQEIEKNIIEHKFREWSQIDIKEFVDLMMYYFDDKELEITTNMIRVLSDDKSFAYEYRTLTMPILKRIEEIELERIMMSESEVVVSGDRWDDEFFLWCKNHKNEYMDKGRFITLLNISAMKEKLVVANAIEIYHLCDALKTVYSFSNLYDVFITDYETICDLKKYIDENEATKINAAKSRAKEIALVKLKRDLEQYKYHLVKENFTI